MRGPPQDLARLSRWMAGKAVGLVLSGGGSRGLAHLGVLHALDTAGIPIDVVGGTSQATTPPRLGALQPAATYRAGSRGEGGGVALSMLFAAKSTWHMTVVGGSSPQWRVCPQSAWHRWPADGGV